MSYSAPATVTPTRLDADLGALGRISAEIAPSGGKKTVRTCDGGLRTVEPHVYRVTFEFHGELGYADAMETETRENVAFLFGLGCSVSTSLETGGAGLPGARLRTFLRHGDRHLSLQLNKNRPGKTTVFSASLAERRGEIHIERSVSGRLPARAFEYDPMLRTATIAPTVPFSGAARFDRRAGADRWTGNLSLDFPGERRVPLACAGFSVHLVHARRS